MQNLTRKIRSFAAIGVVATGLMVGGALYADDSSSSNMCTNYSGSGDDACCDTQTQALCQIDTDMNNNFQNVLDLINKYFQVTSDFVSGYLATLTKNASGSIAYIDNDTMNQDVAAVTTGTISKLMKADTNQQLDATKQMAGYMPGISGDNYNVNNFSMSTLMNNPGIDQNAQQQVQQMILTLSNTGNPVKNLDASVAGQTDVVAVQQFLASLGAYNAASSNAMNVLYGIMQERTIADGLNSTVGVSQPISPMQMDMNSVNQILSYSKDGTFDNASMLEMAKASYYAQAQMLYELYKLRESMQQLNATMAVIQLQLLNSIDKSNLDQMRQKATNQ